MSIATLFAARLAGAAATAFGVATIVFVLAQAVPGDAVDMMLGESAAAAERDALRADLGLDRPLWVQYRAFTVGVLRGDLGHSLHTGEPVAAVIRERLPYTIALAGAAFFVALLVAVPAGFVAALRPGGLLDRGGLALALVGVAIPNFWLGPMLVLVFSVLLGWLPVSGADSARHAVLPALTLGTSMAGVLARMLRASLLEAAASDHVRTAVAKGLTTSQVLLRHVAPTALGPVLTIAGLQLGGLLAGAIITEAIFAWPGLGRLVVESILGRDLPLLQGTVLAIALLYVAVNLATDLVYALVDPRLRRGAHDEA